MAAVTSMVALGISAGAALLQAKQQSDALNASADFQDKMSGVNERLTKMQSDDALARGETAANAVSRNADSVRGSQRAGFAAQGIALDTGSAQDVQTQTAEMGALDALTIRNNAFRESQGYKIQGETQRATTEFNSQASRNTAGATLLTGGLQAASRIAQMGSPRSGYRGDPDTNAYDYNRASGA